MDISSVGDYTSDIKDGYYIIIEDNCACLYYYHNINYECDVESLSFSLAGKEIKSNGKSEQNPITDFINNNKDVFEDIENIILRKFKSFIIKEYQYLNGWEHVDINDNKIYIKDNNITLEQGNDIIKDGIYKFYFVFKKTFDTDDDILYLKNDKYHNDSIHRIYMFIKKNHIEEKIFDYYYKQKKTLNRIKVIDEITG